MRSVGETGFVKACTAVLPGDGEDGFALRLDGESAMLCVCDGCGGLGAARYEALQGRTGAYWASRIAAQQADAWASAPWTLPSNAEQGEAFKAELEQALSSALRAFSRAHPPSASRVVGSLRRTLPTTICLALVSEGAATWREVCFAWAGDSRGYLLDANGLHQCTADHLRGAPDAFESLALDAPLSNFLSAEQPVRLSLRRLRATLPCLALVATDGAYACAPTPMEFEMLLLDYLKRAASWKGFERALSLSLRRLACDDATVLADVRGFLSFQEARSVLLPRREALKRGFVTPVRRRREDRAFARERWERYRADYDWSQGGRHERMDWRI